MKRTVEDYGFNTAKEGEALSLVFSDRFIGLSSCEGACRTQDLEDGLGQYALLDWASQNGSTKYDTLAIDPRFPNQTMRFAIHWPTSVPRRVLNEASPSGKAIRYLVLIAFNYRTLHAGADSIITVMGRDIASRSAIGRVGHDIRRVVSVGNQLLGIPSRQTSGKTIPRPFTSGSEDKRADAIRGQCPISLVLRTKGFHPDNPPTRLIKYLPLPIKSKVNDLLRDAKREKEMAAA